MFKDKVKLIAKVVNELSEEEKLKLAKNESVEVTIDGEKLELKGEWFNIELEKVLGGEGVEVIELKDAIVIVEV